MPSSSSSSIKGFTRDFSGREAACIGIFGSEGSGKTRLCASAGLWSADHDCTPGWLVCDRKTRKTVREVCAELGLEVPYINNGDFIAQSDALAMATLDRDKDDAKVKTIYASAYNRLLTAAVELADNPSINPIVFETGTAVWDWIGFAHFGRKQDVGKSRVWGPPKQDWTDLMDALSHKTVLITLWERDEYKNDQRTGFTKPDGPPHIGFTTTSIVRLNNDRTRKLQEGETYVDRFSLDVYESQDNKGWEGVNAALIGEAITFSNLMGLLRPEE